MSSESLPHIVYPTGTTEGEIYIAPNYKTGFDRWKLLHHYKTPYLMATIKIVREIDPAAALTDVNE